MRWTIDHLVTLYELHQLFRVERHARMIDSINLNDVGRKWAWPVLRQDPEIHLDRLRKITELFVIIVVDTANIRTVRKKALIFSDWVAVLGNRIDVAFMFERDSWLSRRDCNDSDTLNFSSYTTEAESVIFIKTITG